MVTTNKYYGTDDTAKYGNNITLATSNGNGNGDDTDSDADADADADADSEKEIMNYQVLVVMKKWSDFRIIICCNWNITIR